MRLNRKPLIISLIICALWGLFAFPSILSASPLEQAKTPTATRTPTKTATPTRTPTAVATARETVTAEATVTATPLATSEVVSDVVPAEVPALDESNGPPFDWSTSDNYLILGTDRRPGWTDWRTDTIMIVGFDQSNARAAVFSIPRDLYVQIPGYGMGRINQVDFMGERRNGEGGGPMLVSQVLSETLGVSAQHWVRVQMDGFVSFVDAVGGVTVTLDCPFSEPIFNLTTQSWDEFTLPAGDNLLDGESAYWFVRLRLRESDIGRANRQRQFLWALRNKVLSTNLITRAPDLWSAFNGTFSTDLNLLQLIDMGSFALQLQPQNVRASGLTLADLQNFVTSDGQQVLRIGNSAYVRAKIANIWAAPAMADSNRHNATNCQPLPDPSALNLPAPALDATSGSTPANETGGNAQATPQATASNFADPTLAIGNRVRVRKGYVIDVRSKAGANAGKVLGQMADGSQAVILNGPADLSEGGSTIVYWYVRTDSGSEGWVPANTSEAALLQPVR